jgi:hypothetical protein
VNNPQRREPGDREGPGVLALLVSLPQESIPVTSGTIREMRHFLRRSTRRNASNHFFDARQHR